MSSFIRLLNDAIKADPKVEKLLRHRVCVGKSLVDHPEIRTEVHGGVDTLSALGIFSAVFFSETGRELDVVVDAVTGEILEFR